MTIDGEQMTLGWMLGNADAAWMALRVLEPLDFTEPRHRRIFEAAMRVFWAGKPVDLLTVAHELKQSGEFEAGGGFEYLSVLLDSSERSSGV